MIDRRRFLQLGTGSLACYSLGARWASAGADPQGAAPIRRPIPATGELLPALGMGTSRTFDTPADPHSLARLTAVLGAFFDAGGTVVDSSPMYGEAESRVGDVLRAMGERPPLFAATKVWTRGRTAGIAQMVDSARRMGVNRFDLIAVHNLVDWQTQLATLQRWRDEGKVRYIGITTSHGREHEALLAIMRRQPLDFVQFSYNIEDRVAERRLLPLAAERGIATMVNRPFQRGALFGMARNRPLPEVADEIDCASWAQFFLKFILGHPAVTCVIPATARVQHMQDNMGANFGRVPDDAQRDEMLRVFDYLQRSA